MAAAHVFTRYAHPRYELRGAAGGAVPCANVPHVVESLQRLGAQQITDAQVYALVREGGEQCDAVHQIVRELVELTWQQQCTQVSPFL